MEAIIKSMTIQERRNPTILNGSRKKRIAAGSGTRVQDVNRLLKQFEESRKLMKQLTDAAAKKANELYAGHEVSTAIIFLAYFSCGRFLGQTAMHIK